MEEAIRVGGGDRQEAARFLRVVGSGVPFGTVWYAEDTSRILRRMAARMPDDIALLPGPLDHGQVDRLAPGMSGPEFHRFLADAVEEGDREPLPGFHRLPMSPREARARYPVMSRTRPGEPPRARNRSGDACASRPGEDRRRALADLHAEIRHAQVFFADDDALRDNLGHTVDGACLGLLDTWAVLPEDSGEESVAREPADPATLDGGAGGNSGAQPDTELYIDGVVATLLALCEEEATGPDSDPLTAAVRFLRLADWGAPLGAMRDNADAGRDLRHAQLLPEGPYTRLAADLFSRRLPHTPGDPERVAFLAGFAGEMDDVDRCSPQDVSELPMSAWEGRKRYPGIAGITFTIEYGDHPTLAANLAERLEAECSVGCRTELASLLAEITHVQTFFDDEAALRENLTEAFSWISVVGAIDEAAATAEGHLARRHPPT